jgi:site-specific recombinase XerD
VAAKFTFPVHSHMLRHACGFKLANDGHDTRAIQAYLGHRSIMSTALNGLDAEPLQKLLEGLTFQAYPVRIPRSSQISERHVVRQSPERG